VLLGLYVIVWHVLGNFHAVGENISLLVIVENLAALRQAIGFLLNPLGM